MDVVLMNGCYVLKAGDPFYDEEQEIQWVAVEAWVLWNPLERTLQSHVSKIAPVEVSCNHFQLLRLAKLAGRLIMSRLFLHTKF